MDAPTPQDGETDPFTLAAQERWLDLARLGQEAWNTWAEAELEKSEDERTAVDFSNKTINVSDFQGFIFPADADFSESTFSVDVELCKAVFLADAYFDEAIFLFDTDFSSVKFSLFAVFYNTTFRGDVDFSGAEFSDYADFREAVFLSEAYFNSAEIKSVWILNRARIVGSFFARSANVYGHTYLTDSSFFTPPDLISTTFSQPPSLLGSTFLFPCVNRFIGSCSIPDGEARFRRLKQLAVDTHDHELELRLFAHETKAKRFHSLHAADPLHWPGLVLNFAYDWASDFGQSVLRPLGWLLVTVVCALFAYETMTGRPDMLGRGLIEFSDAAKVAAIANVFPFAGQAVIGREIMTTGLCPMVEGTPEHLDCLTALYTISAAEGIFGLIFLFLIGLGLRNRFRIK